MLNVIFLLLLLIEITASFYLPAEYRYKRQIRIKRANDYLHKFGYFEIPPLCPMKSSTVCARNDPIRNRVTQEKALKRFQQSAGIKQTGIMDEATIKMMDASRCGNSDAQKLVKKDFLPWKRKWIKYAFLNFTEKIEKDKIRSKIWDAFYIWQMGIPLKFVETQNAEEADIKILFAKGEHGDEIAFDGPGGTVAHGETDGQLHFDDDENWTLYANGDIPDSDKKDLFWAALHEIGHVLGLVHSVTVVDSIMTPYYRNSIKRDLNSYGQYAYPLPLDNDIENIRMFYGGRASKASLSGTSLSTNCTEFCFV